MQSPESARPTTRSSSRQRARRCTCTGCAPCSASPRRCSPAASP